VIGTAAGGEVLGALHADCNVVGVESDERQFQLLEKVANDWKMSDETEILESSMPSKDMNVAKPSSSKSSSSSSASTSAKPVTLEDLVKPKGCESCGSDFEEGEKKFKCDESGCIENGFFHENCTEIVNGKRVCSDHARTSEFFSSVT
jgi:hypothetical protein